MRQAILAGADIAMLDDFSLQTMAEAVATNRSAQRPLKIEASGGVTKDTIRKIAETGVDYISVGSITKHVRAIDLSMRFEWQPRSAHQITEQHSLRDGMRSIGEKPNGLRLERMRFSPLWGGEGFRNIQPILPGLRNTSVRPPSLKEFLCAGGRRVPSRPLPALDPRETWLSVPGTGLRATWLGHSTVLIEIDGVRILTDPVWGSRASPSRVIGPKRFQPVPVALRAMPPIDAVIVSHDHYDHLDYPTIRELAKSDVPFVTSLGVGAHLEAWGVPRGRITELDWWETHALPNAELSVTAVPVAAFLGSRLQGPQPHTLVVHGDLLTAAQGIFQRRHGFDAAVRRDPPATRSV